MKGYALTSASSSRRSPQRARRPAHRLDRETGSSTSNQLTETLKSLFAVAEAYPDLKANQNFLSLQAELTDTQDKIMAAQRFYNANVRDFNTAIQVFPTNLIASSLGFTAFEFIEAAPGRDQQRRGQVLADGTTIYTNISSNKWRTVAGR